MNLSIGNQVTKDGLRLRFESDHMIYLVNRWRSPIAVTFEPTDRHFRTLSILMVLRLFLFLAVFTCAHASATESLRTEIERYCFECHGNGTRTEGRANLSRAFAHPQGLTGNLDLIEEMIERLGAGEMPPEDAKQPTVHERDRWIAQLKGLLQAQQAKYPSLGRVPIRRMNRFQYNNAVGRAQTDFNCRSDGVDKRQTKCKHTGNWKCELKLVKNIHRATGKLPRPRSHSSAKNS